MIAWLENRRFWGSMSEEPQKPFLIPSNYPFPALFSNPTDSYLSICAHRCILEPESNPELPVIENINEDRTLKKNYERVSNQLGFLLTTKGGIRVKSLLVSIKKSGLILYIREIAESYLYPFDSRFEILETDEKTYAKLGIKSKRGDSSQNSKGKGMRNVNHRSDNNTSEIESTKNIMSLKVY